MANTTTWLNISSMSGTSGLTYLSLTASRNFDDEDKYAEIVAYNSAYNITARTRVSLARYSKYPIPYTANTSTVNYTGETRTITIDTTNLVASSITVSVSGATGVTTSYDNGILTVVFPENIGRERDITIEITGVTTDGVDAEAIIYYQQDSFFSNEYLTFLITTSGTIRWTAYDSSYTKTIQYKKNDGEWTSITSNTGASAPSISVASGDTVQFRGNNATYSNSSYFNTFSGSTAKFNVEGNIMSLIDSTGFATATTLASSYTFYLLFRYCTGLTSAENLELPATTLADYCYSSMFSNCSGLTTAPELPATTLANYCYYYMFNHCTSLTTAPELSATTLANSCYDSMFKDCTSLTAAPALPATTLVGYCYQYMFSNCTSLTTAPELAATTMAEQCYFGMFDHCTSLTTAPELPATTLASSCYASMFGGCTSLVTAPELPATILANTCYWCMFQGCTSLTEAPEFPATTLANSCYWCMFKDCTSLTTAPALSATALTQSCCRTMFEGCTSLTTVPTLPATRLSFACYIGMFKDCTSLTTAPELPATRLADYCYDSMFIGCTSLTTAPELSATTLAEYCYCNMFNGCTSLTTAPELPATRLTGHCYETMFSGCTSLNYIKCLATHISATNCTTNWVNGVQTSSGTFVTPSSTNWSTGNDGIPSGWTRVNA